MHHGLVEAPEDWPYSNYLEWIEKRPGTLVDRNVVRNFFSKPEEYVDYVESFRKRRTFQEAASFLEGWEG